ncbi:MAG: HD domain-containing protein [Rhizomicrobium sp.]
MTDPNPGSTDIIDRIADIFARRGAEAYLGERVTVAEHMLQTATLAQAEGASDALIATALLHDIGHFTSEFGEYSPGDTIDKLHEAAGAKVLAGYFPTAVTEAVRLHVAAKRYLCATDQTYYDKLSGASKHSLSLQGGPMRAAEVAAFRRLEHHEDAVRLRRWDDGGKTTGRRTLTFDAFRPLLQRVAVRDSTALIIPTRSSPAAWP